MKYALAGFFSVICLILFLFFLNLIGIFSFFTDQVTDTAAGVVDQTLDADNVLTNYEQFKDDYHNAKAVAENVRTAEASMQEIKDMYGDPANWTESIRKEYNFNKQTRDGILMQYQAIVKTYNANSEKLNRNLFKDKNLPYQLPLNIADLQ